MGIICVIPVLPLVLLAHPIKYVQDAKLDIIFPKVNALNAIAAVKRVQEQLIHNV